MSDSSKAVFLSYASQDAEAAKRICDALRQAGVEVWFDQSELRGGDAWDQSIRKQIKACALFVPVISANTQARSEGYFRLEWKLADDRTHLMARGTRFILPVCVDDTKDWDAIVPDSFTTVQWTRLPVRPAQGPGPVEGPAGEGATAFAERVKKLLSGEVAPVSDRRTQAPIETDAGQRPTLPRKSKPVWPWMVAAVVALPVLYFIFKPRRSPEEIANLMSAAQTIAANAAKATTAAPAAPPLSEARELVTKAWQALESVPEPARAELEAATELCKRAASLDPTDAEVWAAWSQVETWYVAENVDASAARRESARAKATKAMNLAPKSYEARLAQAVYLVRGEGFDTASSFAAEAEQLLRELLREKPDEPRALLALGHLLRNSRRLDEAGPLFDRLALNPAWLATATNAKGWMYFLNGRFDEAGPLAAQSVAARPFYGNVCLQVRLAMQWQGDLELAKAALERLPVADLREDAGATLAIEVYRFRREPEQMLRVLHAVPREWLESLAGTYPKSYLIGLAHQMAGNTVAARLDWQAALKLVDQGLANETNSGEGQSAKGSLLALLGERPAAEQAFALAKQLGWLGGGVDSALLLGDQEAAITELEKASTQRWAQSWAELRLNPDFDPLRANPRFQALLAAAEKDPKRSPRAKLLAGQLSAVGDQPSASGLKPQASGFTPSGPPPADSKSVAVLAFANLSDDKNNEYFSDGISEELLNVLAKVPGLKVTARTSSFHFKGKDTPIPEIAKELGVAYVIEGSVRKSGDRVRITAQLIKAADGFHVWSDTFTRDLKDIFAVQDEIAGLIAKNLELKLGEANRPARVVNPEAHQLYLQGKYFLNQYSLENARRAADLLQRAVGLDPEFALAWAALSRAGSVRGGYADSLAEVEEGFALARRAADRALVLEPDLAAAHLALVEVQMDHEYDWKGAAESLRRAQALAPTDAAVVDIATRLAYAVGQTERAAGLGGQAVALDPVNPAVRIYYGFALDSLRRFPEAEAQFRRVIELNPTAPWGHAGVSFTYISQGRFDEAAAEAELESNEWSRLTTLAMAEWGQKKRPEADDALARLIKANADVAAYQISEVQAFRHDNDRAFEWLERAYRQRDAGLAWCKSDSSLANLHSDPRWAAFLHKLGLADDQLK